MGGLELQAKWLKCHFYSRGRIFLQKRDLTRLAFLNVDFDSWKVYGRRNSR